MLYSAQGLACLFSNESYFKDYFPYFIDLLSLFFDPTVTCYLPPEKGLVNRFPLSSQE